MQALAFYFFATVIVGSAVMVLAARNPVHSVFFLIAAFFNTAGLFILLNAEFLAMILVVVYVGAVAVLFLFVVMMLDFPKPRIKAFRVNFFGLAIISIIIAELFFTIYTWNISPIVDKQNLAPIPPAMVLPNTHALGQLLFTDYFYVFQTVGIILLVAMIGAIVLTHRKREGVKRQSLHEQMSRTKDAAVELRQVNLGEGTK